MKNDQFKNCYYLWKAALLDQLVVFSSRCFDTVPPLWSPPNAFGSPTMVEAVVDFEDWGILIKVIVEPY